MDWFSEELKTNFWCMVELIYDFHDLLGKRIDPDIGLNARVRKKANKHSLL